MTFHQIGDRLHQLRAIPLESVLLATGAQRDHYDRHKWHTLQGSISTTGMKFMNWNQGIGGGGAVDLAMHLNSINFKAAIEWLCHHFPIPCDSPSLPLPRSLTLPPSDPRQLSAVEHYLVCNRAITPSLIQSLIASGRLYADTRGNAVFLMLGKENKPVGAELRGTGSLPWRGMAPGSHKDLGFFSVLPGLATTVVLCESAIDAISCFLLHPSALCVSTSGARPNPRWLPALLSQGLPVYCGFDSDSTGDLIAQHLMALYPVVGRLRPTLHDWNDLLKSHSTIPLPSHHS